MGLWIGFFYHFGWSRGGFGLLFEHLRGVLGGLDGILGHLGLLVSFWAQQCGMTHGTRVDFESQKRPQMEPKSDPRGIKNDAPKENEQVNSKMFLEPSCADLGSFWAPSWGHCW